ncbi:MAG TPA: XRE family transcriptional regulator [Desulfobacterales bacterium]|nr:XRE family transcriptional regulator [Desulfobacterales bacterium]
MDKQEFKHFRKRLDKTQKQIAQLLGTSIKAIHSYEQGWRSVPVAVERQIYFLISRTNRDKTRTRNCWVIKKCSTDQKKKCPAWEYHAGKFCWFINGTICAGEDQRSWREKIKICSKCEVLQAVLDEN